MPIETVVYKCNKCKKQYATEKQAAKCEMSDKGPRHIEEVHYGHHDRIDRALAHNEVGYPTYIDIIFDDGSTARYQYIKITYSY